MLTMKVALSCNSNRFAAKVGAKLEPCQKLKGKKASSLVKKTSLKVFEQLNENFWKKQLFKKWLFEKWLQILLFGKFCKTKI